MLGPLLEPLGLIALVLVFVGFILLQKDDLRDRFVRLAGSRDMQRTTVALDEAATRLSRYLFLQTCINTCFGLIIGTGLWLIGIPNAGLWALMSALLRFVPYVGVPLAFLFPFTLALAVDPGLVQDGVGAGAVWRRRSHCRPGDRAFPLWPQHGPVRRGGGGGGGVLDLAVGTGGPAALHAADHVLCGLLAAMSRA